MNPSPEFDVSALIEEARAAMALSYSPYSHFKVGAALLCSDGQVFRGTNVENISFGLTVCAERIAIYTAAALGLRDFLAIAVIADLPQPCAPCGACRQVMAEFNKSLTVVTANVAGLVQIRSLSELLPSAYGAGDLPL